MKLQLFKLCAVDFILGERITENVGGINKN